MSVPSNPPRLWEAEKKSETFGDGFKFGAFFGFFLAVIGLLIFVGIAHSEIRSQAKMEVYKDAWEAGAAERVTLEDGRKSWAWVGATSDGR